MIDYILSLHGFYVHVITFFLGCYASFVFVYFFNRFHLLWFLTWLYLPIVSELIDIKGHSFEWTDILYNFIGVFLAVGVLSYQRKIR